MQLVETVTLASPASSLTFSSIPQDGTDLVVLLSARHSSAGFNVQIYFNGSTATNYTWRSLLGTGSSVQSQTGATQPDIDTGPMSGGTDTANTFGSLRLYIPNYTSSTAKSVSGNSVSENNGTDAYQQITAGSWSLTSAITSLTLDPESTATFATGTTASLYKITKA